MSARAYKKIRQALKKVGRWKEEAEYKAKNVDKMLYVKDPATGSPVAHPVRKQVIHNVAKAEYKHLKKLYKKGLLKI